MYQGKYSSGQPESKKKFPLVLLAVLLAALVLVVAAFVLLSNKPGSAQPEVPGGVQAPTTLSATMSTEAPVTEPETEPTEPPVYYNPVNGEILDGPFTGRIWANTISNMQENMPHVNVVKADIVMEMFVNMNNIIRCIALYSDFASVEAVGSTRSTRPVFNDIAQHYGLVLSYGGGSETALNDVQNRGIDGVNIDTWEAVDAGAAYRDQEFKRSYENSLLGIGPGIMALAESRGIPMELERDYGFLFQENGTPADGEAASQITLTFTYNNGRTEKETIMLYNEELGRYVWNQYNLEMTDQITGEPEAFTNVLLMDAAVTNSGVYHAVDFNAGGTGYYANGGKIVPITWTCDGDTEPFRFFTLDGEPLLMGQGNTYIAIAPQGSPVVYQ